MKDNDIPKLIELVVKEATRFCGITPADIEDSGSRKPAHVAARRVCVYALKEKIGFETKYVIKALNLKGPTVYKMTQYGTGTYGQKGEEAEGFTNAVNQIVEKVINEFGTLEEIQKVLNGTPEPLTEHKVRKARGPKAAAQNAAPQKTTHKGKPAKDSATKGNGSNPSLPLVIYALSRIKGVTPQMLSEAFGVSIPIVEMSVGHTILASNSNEETASLRTGIERFHALIATS